MADQRSLPTAGEGIVLATLLSTRCLANRIRRAYLHRRPWWTGAAPEAPVWTVSASVLIGAHQADPRLPLDPELFVASQPQNEEIADPWGDLTGPEAARRYRRRVAHIVRRLRGELRRELRFLRTQARQGASLEHLVSRGSAGLSPLGRYLAAMQVGRADLADSLRDAALGQHERCPLYRLACRGLMPEEHYPAKAPMPIPINPLPADIVVGLN